MVSSLYISIILSFCIISITVSTSSSSTSSIPIHSVTINDDPLSIGRTYDGIGAITSNGETRYIYDYAEPYRSQILDFLFLPTYGLSLQILKVEIGSDVQSTLGTEAAHIHNRNEQPNCYRGIQFWYAAEAQKRNPNITIAALEWSGPGFFTNNSFFSIDNINFIISWLDCMEHTWNVTVDYLGIWNEPPITEVPIDYLFNLRSALNNNNYQHIIIDATDTGVGSSPTVQLVKDLIANTSLQDAVNIVSMHHPCGTLPSNYDTLMTTNPIMRAWASEDYSLIGDQQGQNCWGVTPARNWISGNVTATIAWGVAFSALPNVICQGKGFVYANQPWSNSFTIAPAAWAMSMWTWFSQPGWKLLNVNYGSTFLPPKANSTDIMTTLIAPTINPVTNDRDFTIILSTENCTVSCFLTIPNPNGGIVNLTIKGSLAIKAKNLGFLYGWVTNASIAMVSLSTIPVTCQSLECTVSIPYQPNSLYTFTTLNIVPTNTSNTILLPPFTPYIDIGIPDSFPLSYFDDFENTPVQNYGKYFADWDGSFQVITDPLSNNTNHVLHAMTLQRPIPWHCNDVDPITMTAPGYQNYDVSITARIDSTATLEARKASLVMDHDYHKHTNMHWLTNRSDTLYIPSSDNICTSIACDIDNITPVEPYVSLVVRINKPFSGWCPQQTGYAFSFYGNGTWNFQIWPGNAAGINPKQNLILASGKLPHNSPGLNTWHTLELTVYQTNFIGTIDSVQVFNLDDSTFDHGTIGLGSGWHFASFDNFVFNQVGPGTPSNLVLYTQYLDAGATQIVDALVGMIIIPQTSVSIAGLCRFAAKNSSLVHDLYLIQASTNQTLGTVQVDMTGKVSGGTEPYGFICNTFSTGGIPLTVQEKYYIVSSETKGNDWHYGYGPATNCAGDQSVRSPVMGVRKAYNGTFIFPGSVYLSRGSPQPGWPWIEGGENAPRSLGPVNFLVQ